MTVEVPEEAAVIAASLLKKNARSYYAKNMTAPADVLHGLARDLAEPTDTEWDELNEVELL